MSSTNHTTNYNLPQWVGSDKPAWLGDMNPAFSAIDTAIKANEVAAGTAGTDATAAKNNIGTMANLETTEKGTLVGAVNEVNTKAGTAQQTANTAVGDAAAVNTALLGFMQKFNFTSFTNGDLTHTTVTGTVVNDLTLAQNTDGTIFKMYGNFQVNPNASASRSAIPGLTGYYGVNTGLQLFTAPETAFTVKGAGVLGGTANNGVEYTVFPCDFSVGTDGYIYILPDTVNTAVNYGANYAYRHMYLPCIYFNANFGDAPSPTD